MLKLKTRFIVVLVAIIASAGIFYSCENVNEEMAPGKSDSDNLRQIGYVSSAVAFGKGKVRPNQNCDGRGKCGPCFGICIRIPRKNNMSVASPEGYFNANIWIEENFVFIEGLSEFPIVEEDGTVNLNENIVWYGEVINELGYDEITLLQGHYEVDYTNSDIGRVSIKFE